MLCLDMQMRHYLVWNALIDMGFERSRLNWIPVSVCWHVEVKCFVAEEKNNISLSFVLLFYHLDVFNTSESTLHGHEKYILTVFGRETW